MRISDWSSDVCSSDLAIRSSKQPAGAGLVGRRIADNPWTVYCSRDYAELHGIPHGREELAAHPFIGGGGSVWEPYQAWLRPYGFAASGVMQYGSAAEMGRASSRGRGWRYV